MPKSAPKYWRVLAGSYGLYAQLPKRGVDYPYPLGTVPIGTGELLANKPLPPGDWKRMADNPAMRYIQVRYSWRALNPERPGEYAFDRLIGPVLDACAKMDRYCRFEILWNTHHDIKGLGNSDMPVPAYMLAGYHDDHVKSSGAYNGGCHPYVKPNGHTKLWPKMWIPAVGNAFTDMCVAMLEYARAHQNWDRFMGIQLTETLMQGATDCVGHANPAMNWSGNKLLSFFTNLTDAIYETWPEPLHSIYANWGSTGKQAVMSEDQWRTWLDRACLHQGFGYGCPDTWNIHNLSDQSDCANLRQITTSGIGRWAYKRYQDRGIIIQSTQNSGTFCHGRPGDRWPVALLNYARGATTDPQGNAPRANLFISEPTSIKQGPTTWNVEHYFAAVGSGQFPLPTQKASKVGNTPIDLPNEPFSATTVTFHDVPQEKPATVNPDAATPRAERMSALLPRITAEDVASLNAQGRAALQTELQRITALMGA